MPGLSWEIGRPNNVFQRTARFVSQLTRRVPSGLKKAFAVSLCRENRGEGASLLSVGHNCATIVDSPEGSFSAESVATKLPSLFGFRARTPSNTNVEAGVLPPPS